jgi:uncharacterized protein (TIGR00290 family)
MPDCKMKERIVFCWSGGKDSALALHRLMAEGRYEIVALITTCSEQFQRVAMHGVRLELLEAQAASIGVPLEKVFLSQRSSNEEYQHKMALCLRTYQARGVSACAFGDIFLEDLRQWREHNLAQLGLRGLFPIWKIDSHELLREFFSRGFAAVVCCASDAWFKEDAVGRTLDEAFIQALPPGADPCGENGEFHSFTYAGPIFARQVKFRLGERVYRPLDSTAATAANSSARAADDPLVRGFWYCDLISER